MNSKRISKAGSQFFKETDKINNHGAAVIMMEKTENRNYQY